MVRYIPGENSPTCYRESGTPHQPPLVNMTDRLIDELITVPPGRPTNDIDTGDQMPDGCLHHKMQGDQGKQNTPPDRPHGTTQKEKKPSNDPEDHPHNWRAGRRTENDNQPSQYSDDGPNAIGRGFPPKRRKQRNKSRPETPRKNRMRKSPLTPQTTLADRRNGGYAAENGKEVSSR